MAVLDRIVDDHQSVAVHRPRYIARPLLLAVGILRAQLLHLQVHLQRVRRGVERRLIVHQEDDVLALDYLFVSVSFRHKKCQCMIYYANLHSDTSNSGKHCPNRCLQKNTAHATRYFLLETVGLRAEYPYLCEQNKYVKL
nr:MAG TPA: hypothetical protein [Caudoviricetes sp.]